jgi:hypothetical protein
MRKPLLATAALLLATPAPGAECTNAPVGSYQAPGFSCTVGALTFSDFTVALEKDGSGATALGNLYPVTIGDRPGLAINYSAVAYEGGSVMLSLSYNVSGQRVSDAFAVLAGVAQGGGQLVLNEQAGSGSLSMNGAGSTSARVPATDSMPVRATVLHVSGDGYATSSILIGVYGAAAAAPAPRSPSGAPPAR